MTQEGFKYSEMIIKDKKAPDVNELEAFSLQEDFPC
jgi:hypothetical protein